MAIPAGDSVNSRNINLWKDAEVWVSDDDAATVATDGTFGVAWAFVGLLAEGSSVGREQDADRNDINSFGGKKQMTDVVFRKDTRTFDAIEDNATTYELLWPGSTYVEDGVSVKMAPREAASKVVAFKTVNSHGDVHIDISRRKADIYATSEEKSDDGAETKSFTVDVMADDSAALYDHLRIRDDGTTVNQPVAPIRIEGVSEEGEIVEDPVGV